MTPQEAVALLNLNLKHSSHRFWTDEIGYSKAVDPFVKSLTGHKQVTDGYLLGLAIYRKGQLVTLDRGLLALVGDRGPYRDAIVLI